MTRSRERGEGSWRRGRRRREEGSWGDSKKGVGRVRNSKVELMWVVGGVV